VSRVTCTVAGIDSARLRLGLAKCPQCVVHRLVRVAGGLPGPALGPAALSPASVFFDFPGSYRLGEPLTRGLDSRRTRLLADQEVA
jgi:hypothetical protein